MVYNTVFEIVYKLFFYLFLITGLWILLKPYIMPTINETIKGLKQGLRLRQLRNKKLSEQRRKVYIYRHIDLVLQSTWRFYSHSSPVNFVILTSGLFLSSFIVYIRHTSSIVIGGIGALCTALLPYFVLRIYLQLIRSQTSYQLVPAVSILLASYRANNKDIYFAILQTIKSLDDITLKKAFIKLANSIQSHKKNADIENAVELFIFKIQTSWAKQLGVLLLNGLVYGRDIERSLSNIVNDIKDGQNIIEQELSERQDTIKLGFLPIIAFPVSILFLKYMSGRFDILYYQFQTAQGLSSFLIVLFLSFISFITAILLKKPKNDI